MLMRKIAAYARQRAEVNVVGITQGTSGVNSQLGSGAIVEEISRIRDELFIQQSRTELGSIGYYSAAKDVLSNIETVFNETGENSISDLMQNFFNSFEEVSKFPEQSSYRLSAIYSGKMLSDKLRGVTQQLDEVKNQTDQKLTTEITQVNQLLKKIADVNKRIENVQTDKPNALMDERDKYLDELSSYVDVQVKYTTKPQDMSIKVGNATLLAGTNTYDVKAMYVKERDEWVLGASDVQFKPKAGSLAGTLNTRNGYIATYQNDLNKLVNNLINEVNTIHNSGYGMDGSTGLDFFQGTDSRTIKINAVLESNPEKLALSSENGVIGNSDIAKAIADLKEKAIYGQ
ncbi:flagellar hook-associated protein FlgK [Bacillus megaterium]|nr:flagellar hook-associated protein FlgK [Priestia megaterium]